MSTIDDVAQSITRNWDAELAANPEDPPKHLRAWRFIKLTEGVAKLRVEGKYELAQRLMQAAEMDLPQLLEHEPAQWH
jgi:hypothetical protein